MPHCLIEYSDNIAAEADPRGLLAKVAALYQTAGTIFPTIGIRARAIAVRDYIVADGGADNAFVHATCVIAPGRPEELIQHFFSELFETMKAHLEPIAARRFLGLSLDVVEAGLGRSFKHNFERPA